MRFKILLLLLCSSLFAIPGYFEPWGKDADLKVPTAPSSPPPHPSVMARLAEKVILFHQHTLSPIGPHCSFRPSCSHYMLEAIHRHGFLKGYLLGCDRLARENDEAWVYPLIEEEGKLYKYDPVPN